MEILDAFNSNSFSLLSLVDSINHFPHKPARLGELGLFEVENLATTSVAIEEEYGSLKLIPVAARGGVPEPESRGRRKTIPFEIPHLPTMTQVMAAEVQNVRAFGQGDAASAELMAIEQVRDRKLQMAQDDLEATVEFHRIGALKGIVLDADGQTVLMDLFDKFNVKRSLWGMNFDDAQAKILLNIRKAQRVSLAQLGGVGARVTGWIALCGDDFFDALVGHDELVKLYLNTQAAQTLRDGIAPYSVFPFGGVSWENYRGSVGNVGFVEPEKAYLVPIGVPRLFRHYLAPADYMETVNTLALPYYAKAEIIKFNKGIEMEVQTNPLLLCTRPSVIVQLDMTAES
jgi:hypothetical protein